MQFAHFIESGHLLDIIDLGNINKSPIDAMYLKAGSMTKFRSKMWHFAYNSKYTQDCKLTFHMNSILFLRFHGNPAFHFLPTDIRKTHSLVYPQLVYIAHLSAHSMCVCVCICVHRMCTVHKTFSPIS